MKTPDEVELDEPGDAVLGSSLCNVDGLSTYVTNKAENYSNQRTDLFKNSSSRRVQQMNSYFLINKNVNLSLRFKARKTQQRGRRILTSTPYKTTENIYKKSLSEFGRQ